MHNSVDTKVCVALAALPVKAGDDNDADKFNQAHSDAVAGFSVVEVFVALGFDRVIDAIGPQAARNLWRDADAHFITLASPTTSETFWHDWCCRLNTHVDELFPPAS